MIELVDTHCHIQFPDYELDPETVIADAISDDVTRLVCVGCSLDDSQLAAEFAAKYDNIWASIGLHPHEAKTYANNTDKLEKFSDLVEKDKIVAIGECGLDYYYLRSPKDDQKQLLSFQLELAVKNDLPLIFHVREAFDDFWAIFDEYKNVRGVVHSFSASQRELDQILERDLFVGLNGIMTFTNNEQQLEAVKALPLQKLLLETDAPFLTPVPFRGKICQPKHVRVTASFLSTLRGESLEELAAATTRNAKAFFKI